MQLAPSTLSSWIQQCPLRLRAPKTGQDAALSLGCPLSFDFSSHCTGHHLEYPHLQIPLGHLPIKTVTRMAVCSFLQRGHLNLPVPLPTSPWPSVPHLTSYPQPPKDTQVWWGTQLVPPCSPSYTTSLWTNVDPSIWDPDSRLGAQGPTPVFETFVTVGPTCLTGQHDSATHRKPRHHKCHPNMTVPLSTKECIRELL